MANMSVTHKMKRPTNDVNEDERNRVIDMYLTGFGEISRGQLMELCHISEATASKALRRFSEIYPGDLTLNRANKMHQIGPEYTSKRFTTAEEVLMFAVYGRLPADQVWSPFGLRQPCYHVRPLDNDIVGMVLRAMHHGFYLFMDYLSLRREGTVSTKQVAPIVCFESSGHWYLRAFDLENSEVRTFRLTRILRVWQTFENAKLEHRRDEDWARQVELILIPHPRHPAKQTIAADLGVADDRPSRIFTNAVLASFYLQFLRVDCSEEYCLSPVTYPMALGNRAEVRSTCDLTLAPGYSVTGKDSDSGTAC